MMGKGFISNLEKKDKDTLLKAAQMTNTRIHISESAFDGNGKPIKGCVGVFSIDESQDCSDMWVKYNEMKRDRI